jgi:DNA-binding beta-propeller fold protein YncE
MANQPVDREPRAPGSRNDLVVALGGVEYEVDRPWGDLRDWRSGITDVTVSADGHIFALARHDRHAAETSDPVIELSSEGTVAAAWGRGLTADPHKLAFGPSGNLYIVDRDAHQILICDRNGTLVGAIGERHRPGRPFNHPTDIAFGAAGESYVADGYGNFVVHKFDAGGVLVRSWGTRGIDGGEFISPHGIWITSRGHVLVADRDNNRVQTFDADGNLLWISTGFYRPMSIWGNAAGGLFVTDQVPSLTVLDESGNFLGRCKPVRDGAHGVSGDPATGRIYLAELASSELTRLTPRSLPKT